MSKEELFSHPRWKTLLPPEVIGRRELTPEEIQEDNEEIIAYLKRTGQYKEGDEDRIKNI